MPCTACTTCSVVVINGRWFAECEKTIHGPYLSNEIAIKVATSEALALHRKGRQCSICIRDKDGNVMFEYCLRPTKGCQKPN